VEYVAVDEGWNSCVEYSKLTPNVVPDHAKVSVTAPAVVTGAYQISSSLKGGP
jgi:hypothetical protein